MNYILTYGQAQLMVLYNTAALVFIPAIVSSVLRLALFQQDAEITQKFPAFLAHILGSED